MPEENRVFDVTKPKHVSPAPTSRPVIVGHQPMVADPMVKDKDAPEHMLSHTPTKINVSDGPAEHQPEPQNPSRIESAIIEPSHGHGHEAAEASLSGPAKFDEPFFTPASGPAAPEMPVVRPEEQPDVPVIRPELPADSAAEDIGPAPADEMPAADPDTPAIQPHPADPGPDGPPHHHAAHIEGLHLAEPRHKGGRLKWIAGGLLLLIIIIYLLLDSGLIGTGINLPFHVFKQDHRATPAASDNTAGTGQTAQPPVSNLPAGFKLYNLSGTNLTFAAPSAWGEPSSTTEQGYSKRGGSNQPDGNYAYLVSFTGNKDVQVAVTSGQYLPPARDRLYYDFLQWCTGTNDGKYYLSVLNFTTADKVDTPSTVSCDQGPVLGADKLDDSTLLQVKATDPAGHTIGDIYTKNLSDKNLPVLRVRDITMTNGADIKTLLGTVKTTPSS